MLNTAKIFRDENYPSLNNSHLKLYVVAVSIFKRPTQVNFFVVSGPVHVGLPFNDRLKAVVSGDQVPFTSLWPYLAPKML